VSTVLKVTCLWEFQTSFGSIEYCLPCLPLAIGKASAKNPFRDSPALEAVANFAAKLKCALDYGIEEKKHRGKRIYKIVFVCRATQKSNVSYARQSRRKNTSAM
jgi:hypothetical protein